MVSLKSVMKKSLVDFIRAAGLLCVTNIIWAMMNFAVILLLNKALKPTNLGDSILVMLVMIIPFVVLSLGIMYLTGRIARNEQEISFRDMFIGIGGNWAKGLLIALVNIPVFLLIVQNSLFYLERPSTVTRVVGIVWVCLAAIWLTTQLYQMALIVKWEKSYWGSLRLAFKMVMKNLLLNTIIFITLAIILVISFPAGLIFLWIALAGIFINNAVEKIREEMFPEEYENN